MIGSEVRRLLGNKASSSPVWMTGSARFILAEERPMVRTARDYVQEVKALDMAISCESVAEAKSAKRKIISAEKKLRLIKRNINQDMKAIRAEYRDRIGSAGQGAGNLLLQLTAGKRTASKIRAAEKRQLRAERDSRLEPYESVKLTIDDVLIQTRDAKQELDDYIAEARAEEKVKEGDGKFCPACGAPVGEADKFCRECGHKL